MDKPGELAVFVRVVDDGGFSAAARSLGLTPSAVSKLVARLESRLGVRLMHRTTRAISLTHEGVVYYQRGARILREIEDAEEAVGRRQLVPRGVLKVNAAVAFATHQLVPLLPDLLDRHPELRVELTVTDRVVDVIEEEVDVAIRIGARIDRDTIARRLAEDHRVLCASPRYLQRRGTPTHPEDLARHDCLAWIGNQGSLNDWTFVGPDGPFVIPVRGRVEVNSGETLYGMTLAGLGIARLAEFLVAADIRAGRLVPLLTDRHLAVPLPIHAVFPHRLQLQPKVRAFVEFLIERFTPEPPWRLQYTSDGAVVLDRPPDAAAR